MLEKINCDQGILSEILSESNAKTRHMTNVTSIELII